MRPSRRGLQSFDYTLTNIQRPIHADARRPRRDVREADPRLRRGAVHGRQAAVEQLGRSRLLPLVAPVGHVRGLLPRRQRAVGSGITSLYRLPDQRSELHGDRRAAVRLPGDIRYLGTLGCRARCRSTGRTSVKVFGNYVFNFGLNAGLGLTLNSGKPLTALAANPNYTNGGEIPLTPRGDGHPDDRRLQDADAVRVTDTDAHVDYALTFSGEHAARAARRRVQPVQPAARRSTTTTGSELTLGVANPDFGKPTTSISAAIRRSIRRRVQIRFGARFEF